MLIISRKRRQKIVIADEIEITILDIRMNRVRFGINAPKSIPIQTRKPESPVAEESPQPNENERQTSPLEGLPAVVGMRKRK